ncbi:MAG: acetate uptake transporter [Bacteroidota bacterium]
MEQTNTIKIIDTTANPAPLGLAAFALTTILLNLHNAGFYGMDAMIMSMGIFYGGLAQLFVGYMEWKKGNTFGTIAFSSYGAFWLSLVCLMILPKMGIAEAPAKIAMAYYLGVWGLFSLFLFIGTLKLNRALQVVFGTLVILFALLAIANATESHEIHIIAGYEGIICGLSALYAAMAQVLNEIYGRTIMPLGVVKK